MIRRLTGLIAFVAIVAGCSQDGKAGTDTTRSAQAGATTAAAPRPAMTPALQPEVTPQPIMTPAPQPTSIDGWEQFDYSAHVSHRRGSRRFRSSWHSAFVESSSVGTDGSFRTRR